MTGIFQEAWDSATDYTTGQRVVDNGVVYEKLSDDTDTEMPFDNSLWKPVHIIAANNVYGIIEACRFEANAPKNDRLNNSFAYLLGLAQKSLEREIRVPSMLDTRYVTIKTNADSEQYIDIPEGLLEPLRINLNEEQTTHAAISIKRCDPTEFRQLQLATAGFYFTYDADTTVNPLLQYGYLPEGRTYKIAPNLNDSDEIVVYGYYREPALARSAPRINNRGEALNDSDQTLQEWEDDGNNAADFVQAVDNTISNWFSKSASDALIYGTLVQAQQFVKDDGQIQYWQALYQKAKEEIMNEVMAHGGGTEEFISLSNGAYPS